MKIWNEMAEKISNIYIKIKINVFYETSFYSNFENDEKKHSTNIIIICRSIYFRV